MFKQISALLVVIAGFIFFIMMQNYQPSNKKIVAIAVIEQNGKVLIAKRAQENNAVAKWAFPGGKLEQGEDLHTCLQRELREELGIDAKIGDYLCTNNFYRDKTYFEIHAFSVTIFKGQISLNEEHTEFAWVSPVELSNYDMLEFNEPVIKLLQTTYI